MLAALDAGKTLVCASHDLHLLGTICERVVRLDQGRVVDDGPAARVIAEAGGAGWAGGSSNTDGGVVLHEVQVTPTWIPHWEPFAVQFDVEVIRESPNTCIEFSIRDTIAAGERDRPRSPDEVLISTLGLQRISDLHEVMATPGRWTVVGHIQGLPLLNSLDLVVSVLSEFEGTVLSEQWRTVSFGGASASNAAADVRWVATVDPRQRDREHRTLGGEGHVGKG